MSLVAKTQEAEPSIATPSSSRIPNALIGRMMGDSGKRPKPDDNSSAAGLLLHVAAAGSDSEVRAGGQDKGSPAKSGRSLSKGGAAKRARTEPSPGSPPRSARSIPTSSAPSPSTGGASPRRKSRNDGQASSEPATPSRRLPMGGGASAEADGAGAPA